MDLGKPTFGVRSIRPETFGSGRRYRHRNAAIDCKRAIQKLSPTKRTRGIRPVYDPDADTMGPWRDD